MSQTFKLPNNSVANNISIIDVVNDFKMQHNKGIYFILKNIDVHVQIEITPEKIHVKYYTPTAKQGVIVLPKPFQHNNL